VGWQYHFVEHSSGVGVLDKAVLVLDAVQEGATSLAALTQRTGLSRATAHRLAVALEVHRLLVRDREGRWGLGPRLGELAGEAAGDPLLDRAGPVLARLRDVTGESAQLYRRAGDRRICVAAAERGSGLRDTVPVGSVLPLTAGSAAQVLLAWSPRDPLVTGAAFGDRVLAEVRRRGWAHSVAEREQGVASVSAPVHGADGAVVAAVSVSGPLERLTRSPGRLHAEAVRSAADELSRALRPATRT
jgi:DNA-binding IclR family transcriptional regulator